MKIKLIIIICFIFNMNFVFSQNRISGVIIEQSGESLPFSNIVLYKLNNKVVKGTSSNDIGYYAFENISDGSYRIVVSVLGFEIQKSKPFMLSEKNKEIKLNFTLKEESQTLNEVVIKSTRPVIRQTAEKLIINLENSEMMNSNLQDVMKKIPGIIVTNGNISYAGQQGVRILINGKTTNYMDTDTLLRDLPADNIAKVELIQQPGAEFDAEGSGAIINIILKKNVKLGTNGSIKLNTGYDNEFEYGTSFSIASYKNKLNWQVSTGYKKSAWREDLFINRKVNELLYSQASISPFHPKTFRLSGALDYYINNEHSVGVSTSRIFTDSDRVTSNSTIILGDSSSNSLFTESDFDKERVTFNINPFYKFDNGKEKVVFDVNYIDYNNDNTNDLFKRELSTIDYSNQRYLQNGAYHILTYKLDYKHTFNDNFNWMFGSKFSKINTDSNLQSFVQNNSGNFILNDTQSNRFLIDEDISAIYTKFTSIMDEWSFSGGLRWEESETIGKSTNTSEVKKRKISKFFPSANIGRKLSKTFGVNLSYSYRIQRPSYSSLNSFVYYYDPYTFEEGNPNLKPAFTNSFQFNMTYNDQPFFSIGYKDTSDALFEIVTQNNVSAQTSRSTINISKRENWNFKAFAPINFVSELEGYTGFIVNYNRYKSQNLQPNFDIDKWSLTWYTNLEYKFPWGINSEMTGYYSTGGLQGLIEHDWLAGISFGLSKKFMNDKMKVNLGVGEILKRKFKGSIKYNNIDADIISDWSRQNVYLQVSYNFGSKYSKEKERSNSSKDEQDRIKSNN